MEYSSGVSSCLADTAFDEDVSKSAVFNSPSSLICLTVYNEPLSELIKTLSSLLASIRHAHMAHIDASNETGIAIVIDGKQQADPEVLSFLERMGLVDQSNSDPEKTSFIFGEMALADLMQLPKATVYDLQRNPCIVCLKNKNHGKLHSHSLFFSTLCRRMNPKYCFQIDVGTTVATDAIGQMLGYLEKNEHIASVGSSIVTDPLDGGGIVTDWQYVDFALQAAVNWPAEIQSGHLSVLPGQFSAIRWKTLCGKLDQSYLKAGVSPENADCPLDRYLRGLDPKTDMERIMFLAEDRIIGNEILLADDSWKLGYCADSVATTDACKDIGELARQRRRWNNSSTACKFWLFGRWANYLFRENRSFAEKMHFSSAMLWQFLLIVHQLLAPAFAVSIAVLGATAISNWWGAGEYLLLAILATVTALVAALSIPIRNNKPLSSTSRHLALVRTFCELAICGLLVWSLLDILSPAAALLMFGSPILGVFMAITAFKRQWLILLTKSPTFYLLINPLMLCILWCYSVARLQDVSWGTKGLTSTSSEAQPKSYLGVIALSLWLGVNALVIFAAHFFQPVFFVGLDPFLEVRFAIDGLMALLAVSLQLSKIELSQLLGPAHSQGMRTSLNPDMVRKNV